MPEKRIKIFNFEFIMSIRIHCTRILFLFILLFISERAYSQVTDTNNMYYDTTDYIPSFYKGAIDYNLMIAASKGYSSEIERLLGKGANMEAENDEGVTPLIFAVAAKQTKAVNLLIKYGANVNKITSKYETSLLIAAKNQDSEIAEALIRAGADIDFNDRYDATPLHYASIYGDFQLVDMLLYYNASIDKKTVEGTTPLLASIWAGYTAVADLLIQNGANMEARDNEGYTPFLMASYFGDTLLMDLLYKRGVNIYATNNLNHNALTLSILTGRSEITVFLLKLGNKWTDPDRKPVNPYNVASKFRRNDIVNILKKNNVPGRMMYQIDQIALTASSRLFINDIYTGISLSFKEPYLNAGLIAGFDTKLWYSRVLIKNSEHLFYQYMDKGSVAYAGLFKDFNLTNRPDRFNYSVSTMLLAGYSFGNKLKGTLIAPKNKFSAIPSVSFKITKMNFSVNMGIEYLKTQYYHNGPLWLRIGCSYTYFFDHVRTQIKPIRWY
jgi:ankyrin repeat protein